MIVDGNNLVLGRLASKTAELLLKGKKVDVINAEQVVVTGNKERVYKTFRRRMDMTAKDNPYRGPKFYRRPDALMRRAVRGMLPYKSKRGKDAYKNLKVHIGVPEEFKDMKAEKFKEVENHLKDNYTLLGDLSKALGAKW